MTEPTVLLGYELGGGTAIRIPLGHMAVCGITQLSGKTTTLEALAGRSGLRSVTFLTKRGESGFAAARRIAPFFRERCDWRAVEELVEACLEEAIPKGYRPTLMHACEKSKTLAEVEAKLDELSSEGDTKASRDAGYVLRNHLRDAREMVRQAQAIEQLGIDEAGGPMPLKDRLDLQPGINLMDLRGFPPALQNLIIAATIDHICEHETGCVVLMPEARDFLPLRGSSPAKSAAIRLACKGACNRNYLWIDSQELAMVDIYVRNALSVYLLGVQRESNAVRRTLVHIPSDRRKPSEREMMQLQKGWFYASFADRVHCVYVQPPWLDADPGRAKRYASEELPASFVAKPSSLRKPRAKNQAPPGTVSDRATSEGLVQ
jgi:hypothetical protein